MNVSAEFLPRNFRLNADGTTLTLRKMCKRSVYYDVDCSMETDSGPMVIQCNASNEHGYAFANGYINVLGICTLVILYQNFLKGLIQMSPRYNQLQNLS